MLIVRSGTLLVRVASAQFYALTLAGRKESFSFMISRISGALTGCPAGYMKLKRSFKQKSNYP